MIGLNHIKCPGTDKAPVCLNMMEWRISVNVIASSQSHAISRMLSKINHEML